MEFNPRAMQIGTIIKVNKGGAETLIERDGGYGVFKSDTRQVVRRIMLIKDSEIIAKI